MTRAQLTKNLVKNALLYAVLAVAVVLAIPLLAALAWGVRLFIPLLIVTVVVAAIVSPAFRRWFVGEADNRPHYHGVAVPTTGLWVHPAHAWADVEFSGEANVGADALALIALGAVTAIQPVQPGTSVEQGRTLFTLVSGQRRLDIKSPVSGVIIEVNEEVMERPALLSENPYGKGWVVRLEDVALGAERAGLRHGAGVRAWWRAEVDRFTQRLAAGAAIPTMADGGVLAKDLSAQIDDQAWKRLGAEFFGQIVDEKAPG
jgi:glycine cleavage system H protein